MYEIIDDENRNVTISLHLEAIYIEMISGRTYKGFYKIENISKDCVDFLVENIEIKEEYTYYIDFEHVKMIDSNSRTKFNSWILGFSNVGLCNCEGYISLDEELKKLLDDKSEHSCRRKFIDYAKNYIFQKCLDQKGYDTQIGLHLSAYIDVKKITNDSVEMLRWCYVIASDLKKYMDKYGGNAEYKKKLFCHTLNGAYIAGVIAQLLDYDLVYVDHLGPYNKLNKINFYKERTKIDEYIIVTDVVCLGSEFLRAKNIVEYMGGTVKGCVGIVRMPFSDVLEQCFVKIFSVEYTTQETKDNLNYKITTKQN